MALRTDSVRDQLRHWPAFAGLGHEEIGVLLRLSVPVSVAPGTRLWHAGAADTDAYVVLDGTVVVECSGEVVAHLGAGDFVGELRTLDRHDGSTATACTRCRLLALDVRELRSVLVGSAVDGAGLAAALVQRTSPTGR